MVRRGSGAFDGDVSGLSPRGCCEVRVRYGETDAMGYVYYGNYALYFEVGRNELMRGLGIAYADLERSGVMMPVVEMHTVYGVAARYDDLLRVETGIVSVSGASLVFGYRVERASRGEMVVYGSTRMAFVDMASRRPVRVPSCVLLALGAA